MEFIQTIINYYHSAELYLKTASAAISALLAAGIIYCVIKSGYHHWRLDQLVDAVGVGNLSRQRSARVWRQIKKLLEKGGADNWRMAILEADRSMDDLIKMSGYRAATREERLAQVSAAQLPNIEEIRQAHRLARRLEQEEEIMLDEQTAYQTIGAYQKAFQEFGLID